MWRRSIAVLPDGMRADHPNSRLRPGFLRGLVFWTGPTLRPAADPRVPIDAEAYRRIEDERDGLCSFEAGADLRLAREDIRP
ncbi:hypothetical protein KY389_04970 [Paracoccus bogoriensis]|uniref:hypothetical protein n=1 Tax=Paracoccus bogoriensis TaxID=242065 RepID=UPI001CA5E1B9|nr:hypothetical protein [Paracoccus bogoriensis]MBW7056048.1 hypothetical protein [Paracoccus bogoriensis]